MQIDRKRLPFRLRIIANLPGVEGAARLAISPDGSSFLFSAQGKKTGGLYRIGWDGKGLKRLAPPGAKMPFVAPKGTFFYLRKGIPYRIHKGKKKRLRFRAEVWIDRQRARRQKFEEVWTLLYLHFYDPQFHGIDWQAMRRRYLPLAMQAKTNEDFDEAVRMMLGELNASHLGIYTPYRGPRDSTADLGVSFAPTYPGPGLKIAAVRPHSPAARQESLLRPGEIIMRLQGHPLSPKTNIHRWLNWKASRTVVLEVRSTKGAQRRVLLRPASTKKARRERYDAWVESRRKTVLRLSKGRLAYAHIRSMSIPYMARFEREIFAHAHGKEGLIIDVRNNGGGWIADLLLAMFSPKPHAFTRFKGSGTGYPVVRRPFYAWHKPRLLLCNERSVSNAEIFTHAFKNLKLGTVVGMPTYGGVISTDWTRLMDGTWVGVPLRGWWTLPNKINMENNPAVPHVLIPHTPRHEVQGRDPQLRRAVKLLLQQLPKKK